MIGCEELVFVKTLGYQLGSFFRREAPQAVKINRGDAYLQTIVFFTGRSEVILQTIVLHILETRLFCCSFSVFLFKAGIMKTGMSSVGSLILSFKTYFRVGICNILFKTFGLAATL